MNDEESIVAFLTASSSFSLCSPYATSSAYACLMGGGIRDGTYIAASMSLDAIGLSMELTTQMHFSVLWMNVQAHLLLAQDQLIL